MWKKAASWLNRSGLLRSLIGAKFRCLGMASLTVSGALLHELAIKETLHRHDHMSG